MDTLEWLNLTPKLNDVDTWSKLWAVYDDPFPDIRLHVEAVVMSPADCRTQHPCPSRQTHQGRYKLYGATITQRIQL